MTQLSFFSPQKDCLWPNANIQTTNFEKKKTLDNFMTLNCLWHGICSLQTYTSLPSTLTRTVNDKICRIGLFTACRIMCNIPGNVEYMIAIRREITSGTMLRSRVSEELSVFLSIVKEELCGVRNSWRYTNLKNIPDKIIQPVIKTE